MNVCTFCLGVCNCVAAVFESVSVASFTELCQFQFGQKEKEMKELCIRVSRDEESKGINSSVWLESNSPGIEKIVGEIQIPRENFPLLR